MFLLYASKNRLTIRKGELTTSGSVNVYDIRFGFSTDWDDLEKTAVFRAGQKTVSVLLDDAGCSVPWEVLAVPGLHLEAGVYGTRGEEIVLPTVWADLGAIQPGVVPGDEARPPTPELWEQELARKADGLDYTSEGELGLFSGERLLSSVPVQGGGGGVSDHRVLTHREDENQHPISAIVNLEEKLGTIPTAMTAEQLRKILMT